MRWIKVWDNYQSINEGHLIFYEFSFKEILQRMQSKIAKLLLSLDKSYMGKVDFTEIGVGEKVGEVTFQNPKRVEYEYSIEPGWVLWANDSIFGKYGSRKTVEDLNAQQFIEKICKNYNLDPANIRLTRTIYQGERAILVEFISNFDFIEIPPGQSFGIVQFPDGKFTLVHSAGLANPIKKAKYKPEKVGVGRLIGKLIQTSIKLAKKTIENLPSERPSRLWSASVEDSKEEVEKLSAITPKDIEDFVNEFKAVQVSGKGSEEDLEIVEGEKIRFFYDVQNYYNIGKGTLINSCMRYASCQPYFDIYVENPEVCKMIILKNRIDPTKIEARALLWGLRDGSKMMDRIYFTMDHQKKLIETWAQKNGYFNQEDELDQFSSIQLKKWDFRYYPFMDNFKCLDMTKGVLFVDFISKSQMWQLGLSNDRQLTSTKGGWAEK